MTLAVHPRFGEEISVLAAYGRGAVQVETPDGRLRLLPLAWTDLHPRPDPLTVEGRSVRLAPEALLALSAWVRARVDGKVLDPTDLEDQKSVDGVDKGTRAGTAVVAVVGQARSPGFTRRVGSGKRGGR